MKKTMIIGGIILFLLQFSYPFLGIPALLVIVILLRAQYEDSSRNEMWRLVYKNERERNERVIEEIEEMYEEKLKRYKDQSHKESLAKN